MSQLQSLDDILGFIVSSPPVQSVANALYQVAKKEYGDTLFASMLQGGQDPLTVLDPAANTLGFLYILSARVGQQTATPQSIATFCHSFNPSEARYAPDRIHMLAKGISRIENVTTVLPYLLDLTCRYPPSLSYLTTLHPIFLHACVSNRAFAVALPVLSTPITEISTKLSPLTYNDHLQYHYAGGMALTALKRFTEAAEFFEIAASAPVAFIPAAIQLEALKKLSIVQLLLHGTTRSLPRYAHGSLTRLFKNSPYSTFIKAYPDNTAQLIQIVEKEAKHFANDQNIGLLHQAIAKAPRWSIRKLTNTYLTLSLAEIGKAVGVQENEVRGLLLSMIELGEIHATISSEDTVTFIDPAPHFDVKEVEEILRTAQDQGHLLGEIDREIGRSREFLIKALKERDSGAGGGSATWGEEPEVYPSGSYAVWDENF